MRHNNPLSRGNPDATGCDERAGGIPARPVKPRPRRWVAASSRAAHARIVRPWTRCGSRSGSKDSCEALAFVPSSTPSQFGWGSPGRSSTMKPASRSTSRAGALPWTPDLRLRSVPGLHGFGDPSAQRPSREPRAWCSSSLVLIAVRVTPTRSAHECAESRRRSMQSHGGAHRSCADNVARDFPAATVSVTRGARGRL